MPDQNKKQQQKKGTTTHRVVITDKVGVSDAVVRRSTEKLAKKYADTLEELSKT